jgi:hypothetical protein
VAHWGSSIFTIFHFSLNLIFHIPTDNFPLGGHMPSPCCYYGISTILSLSPSVKCSGVLNAKTVKGAGWLRRDDTELRKNNCHGAQYLEPLAHEKKLVLISRQVFRVLPRIAGVVDFLH